MEIFMHLKLNRCRGIISVNSVNTKVSHVYYIVFFYHFYPRDAMLARVLAVVVSVSVCLSVWHAGIVSKWLNIGWHKQRQVIAQGLLLQD